jgi:hypothetical protein
MTEVAHEVSRRMTTDYAKERARDMARHKAYELRERAVDNQWLGPLLGAGLGALVGRVLISRAQERRTWGYDDRERWSREDLYRYGDERAYRYDREAYGYEPADTSTFSGYGEGTDSGDRFGDKSSELKERAEGAAAELKDKAQHMKERLGAKTSEYSGRLRGSAEALGNRIPDRHRIRSSAQEQPGMWAFAAMVVGALFGLALPLSDSERRIIEPAKDKLREAGSQAMDMAESRVSGGGESREEPSQTTAPSPSPSALSSPTEPLH